jgi:hypothetical protein
MVWDKDYSFAQGAPSVSGGDADGGAFSDLLRKHCYRPLCPRCKGELIGLSAGEYQDVCRRLRDIAKVLSTEERKRRSELVALLVALDENPLFKKELGDKNLRDLRTFLESRLPFESHPR